MMLSAVGKLPRCHVSKGAVTAVRVAVVHTRFEDRLRLLEQQELMGAQLLVTQRPAEELDDGIIGRLPKPREIGIHAAIKRPRVDGPSTTCTAMAVGSALWQS